MKKSFKKSSILGAVLVFFVAGMTRVAADETAPPSLEDQLSALQTPINTAPGGVTQENLYSVQSRYSPLTGRHELGVGLGKNFNTDPALTSNQVNLSYRFHFDNRWSAGLQGSFVFNELSGGTRRLFASDAILPDVAYVENRADLTVGYNLFHGKFRLSSTEVFYFDNYVMLGGGMTQMNTGSFSTGVADFGFAFWLGKWGSARVGVRDYIHNEQRKLSSGVVHDVVGYLGMGILLGGST